MFPLHDDIPSRTTPIVNWTMIGLCAAAFFAQLAAPEGEAGLVERYGLVPVRLWSGNQPLTIPQEVPVQTAAGVEVRTVERVLPPAAINPWLTLFTCLFLHGGWMHFLGNMWFLHIFGDNVEDRLGHAGYALFYLGCGLAASIAHVAFNFGSSIPTIGASGAIAGVMGAYLCLYPRAQVLTIVPLFIFIQVMTIPAPLFLGIWFVFQTWQGTMSADSQGVAWWAHIGGFIAGYLIARLLQNGHVTRPPVDVRRSGYRIPLRYVPR